MTLAERFGAEVHIAGWSHTPFGKLEASLEDLVVSVSREALARAAVEPGEVDAIFLGQFNSGIHPLGFASSLALQASDDLFGRPATRVENACASGSAAVHQGVAALLAGTARTVLVVGAEKMSQASAEVVGAGLLGADYESAGSTSTTGFAGLFAEVANAYSERYGDCSDTLAAIAAKSHYNALANPFAHLRKDFDEEFCRTVSDRNPMVASPLRRTDCSPVSDGAAALVLTSASTASGVKFLGFGQANDFLPAHKRDPLAFAGSELAWHLALEMSGVTLADLSLVELHDCFTIAELNLYEVLGLAERGKGAEMLADGRLHRDGVLPVNPSGGLKSKGHPVGATGVSQHVLAAMQLTGTAGGMQVPDAQVVAVHNMGGLAVANHVSILAGA
ncbi:thiolase domain-containing protein [Nocardioides sp. AE5]|uniref:thiolase domain-containing protein n=1 Tax=Nocardioides sp. AE5 TaxID=2962573 RepID=UPI002880C792|nr:thiolase domain-containing protein [Nocardioides sp. AE5]MDT0202615.1 thiolase domain-containing protein [Nocardioides sp. AE5]